MDESFREYFRGQTEAFESSLLKRQIALSGAEAEAQIPNLAVQAGLEAARLTAEERGLDLREDAQLLIAILAREMVARPVSTVTPEDTPMLPGILEEDIGTIVREAGEMADNGEVSAHAVIDGLSSSWDRLRSSNLRVWDRHGR